MSEQAKSVLPLVSVVLPTRNRSQLLRNCMVNGLFRQSYPADRWEIVLVNDGSTDDTEQVVQELARQSPVPVRCYRLEGEGAARARNVGTEKATGDIVAHIDDDGCPVPEWLAAGVAAFEPGVAIVTGPILPNPEQPVKFFSFVSESYEDQGIYPTSNIFFLRSVFMNAGGFSDRFGVNRKGRPAWGWDTDLAWRILRQGYRAVFVSEAATYDHVFDLTPSQWLLDPWKAHALPNVVRHVPEIRDRVFPVYPFFDRVHRRWVAGLVGLVLSMRSRWALVLVLPWLLTVARDLGHDLRTPVRWPVALVKALFLWARQLVLFVSLVSGSIRYRKVIL